MDHLRRLPNRNWRQLNANSRDYSNRTNDPFAECSRQTGVEICVEFHDMKRYGPRFQNSVNGSIGTHSDASKPCSQGFDSLRPLQIPMQKPLTPTSARGFLFSGFPRLKPGKDRKRPMYFGGGAAGRFLFLTSSASRPAPTGPDRYPEAAAGALRRCAARWRTFPRPTHVPGR